MYKKLFISTIGFIFILFTACQSHKKQVQSQAQEFLTAYYNGNYAEAKNLSTYTTHQLIDEKQYFQSLNPYNKEDGLSKPRILKTTMRAENAQAVVNYWVDGVEKKLSLKKENGKWLVNMDKSDPIEQSNSFTNKQVDGGGVASAESEPIRISDVK